MSGNLIGEKWLAVDGDALAASRPVPLVARPARLC
jgi:hypothetical protein